MEAAGAPRWWWWSRAHGVAVPYRAAPRRSAGVQWRLRRRGGGRGGCPRGGGRGGGVTEVVVVVAPA
jgi:hypothetical protein